MRGMVRGLGILAAALCFSACTAPSGFSSGRDYWGHRPGPQGFRTVVIDAGHGGRDSGAINRHSGLQEKTVTLDVAKRLASELHGDFRTILIRGNDRFVDLDDRVVKANRHGDAILVSIHFNSGPPRIRGPETYYWRVDSHGLATRIQRELKNVSPSESGNRGLVRRRLRLTRNPEIPCILLEAGYLSHPQESRLIATPAYREKLARAIARAIRAQAVYGDAGTGPLPRPIHSPPSRATDARES